LNWPDASSNLEREAQNGTLEKSPMVANKHFQPDIPTAAHFLQARTALDGCEEVVLLDFEMLDFEPSPTTVGLKCSLADVRKLVHTCLMALESFGDQPASVLLKVLHQGSATHNSQRNFGS
jgi:hypothetical protein